MYSACGRYSGIPRFWAFQLRTPRRRKADFQTPRINGTSSADVLHPDPPFSWPVWISVLLWFLRHASKTRSFSVGSRRLAMFHAGVCALMHTYIPILTIPGSPYYPSVPFFKIKRSRSCIRRPCMLLTVGLFLALPFECIHRILIGLYEY